MQTIAYVGSATRDEKAGIHIYDVNVDTGVFVEKGFEAVSTPVDIVVSSNGEFLYSIKDEGVAACKIENDGQLSYINEEKIGGVRGGYITVDSANRYAFVGGYYDGRVTMMKINEDGSIGNVADYEYHQGMGNSSIEARMEPKVTCVKVSPDDKYLYAVDYGIDQVKVYRIDYEFGKLELAETIRCSYGSEPRMARISKDNKFVYILSEKRNKIGVYSINEDDKKISFEKIQTVAVIKDTYLTAASADLEFTEDEKYIYASIDGINGIACLERDAETGLLEFKFETRISGNYPRNIKILPGNKQIITLNLDTNEIRAFEANYENNYSLMRVPPIKVKKPMSIQLLKK